VRYEEAIRDIPFSEMETLDISEGADLWEGVESKELKTKDEIFLDKFLKSLVG
jgi:hypothetical protein